MNATIINCLNSISLIKRIRIVMANKDFATKIKSKKVSFDPSRLASIDSLSGKYRLTYPFIPPVTRLQVICRIDI